MSPQPATMTPVPENEGKKSRRSSMSSGRRSRLGSVSASQGQGVAEGGSIGETTQVSCKILGTSLDIIALPSILESLTVHNSLIIESLTSHTPSVYDRFFN